ncbi:MAG: EI24 domain-containing protein [Bacteroidota bacterium]
MQGTIDGIVAYLKAFRIISKYRLWIYLLVPLIVGLTLGVGIFRFAWGISSNIGEWLIHFYPFEWGKEWLLRIAEVFGGLLVAAVGLILFRHLVMAITSPFMSFLSETVEKKLTGDGGAPPFSISQFLSDMVRGLRIALRNIIRELFYTLVLFLMGLLLPFLAPAIPIAIFLVQSFYAGFGNIDYTLERHFSMRDSVRFVRKNRGLALGNGMVFMALLLTGIGFLFALPVGTVAATSETLKRLDKTSPDEVAG